MSKSVPLWAHQKECIERAREYPHFALFMSPGVGKSRTTIEICKEKFEKDLNYSVTKKFYNTLILGPIVIVEQWRREWLAYSDINPDHIVALTGTGQQKNKTVEAHRYYLSQGQSRIICCNYDALYNEKLFYFFKEFVKILVCDESSRIKDVKAKRTKRCIELSDKAKYRYILSGSPVLNSQLDIFSQFRVLDHGEIFGKNFYAFRAKYFRDKNAAWKGGQSYFPDWQPKGNTNSDIGDAIKHVSMSVKKEEAIDLPDLVKQEIYVELTPEQRKHYNQMKESLITFLNDKACVAQMALTKCIRLQQLVSGFLRFDDDTEKAFDGFEKLAVLKELLTDITKNGKVLIWCIYKRNYLDIKKICGDLGLGFGELTGEVSNKDLEVRRFQEDIDCKVMICNPQSASLGISLTAAGYSIFYSRSFSLEHDLQAEARNYRGGSLEAGHKKITRIDLIVKESIDELIMIALKQKLSTANDILNLLRSRIK